MAAALAGASAVAVAVFATPAPTAPVFPVPFVSASPEPVTAATTGEGLGVSPLAKFHVAARASHS